jgi:GNAT superfamily N-acetyltransferase
MSDAVEIVRGGVEVVAELRPLWLALRTHHAEVAPDLGPVREDDETWRMRREQYERWLTEDPRNFVLLARRHGRAIGYAFARMDEHASPTWARGAVLDVETLSVLPEARGAGVGKRLLERLRAEVAERGYDGLTLTVVASNRDARRFYEREGLTEAFVFLRDTRGRR